jgi:hypothetical protein
MNIFFKIVEILTKNTTSTCFSKVSYSQSGEDLIVRVYFDILGITNPTYIDIGAHHPYFISNTALFYEMVLQELIDRINFI